MQYELIGKTVTVRYDPRKLTLEVRKGDNVWRWREGCAFLRNFDGKDCTFLDTLVEEKAFETGVQRGVEAEYARFIGARDVCVFTRVSLMHDDTLRFEVRVKGEFQGQLTHVLWPAPMAFDFDEGGTVLPMMQGVLVPARWPKPIKPVLDGQIYDRDGYMPVFGQYTHGAGYVCVFDTPYDAAYFVDHEPGGHTDVRPAWRTSLDRTRYKRVMTLALLDPCDHNEIAMYYRRTLEERGALITLRQKIDRNPNVEKLIGTPIVHTGIAVHISPDSHYYTKGEPKKNDYHTSFAERAEQLRALKARGVERAYLHLDGWGKHGYDNLHPDVFPPHEAAGGADGMRALSDTCRELGYTFGIHDQYRDYYADAETYDENNAVLSGDGRRHSICYWYGGKQVVLCAQLARDYVRRNFDTFKALSIRVEGAYLDVFSVVGLDECFDPEHLMTREQCAEKRRECFDYLNSIGVIPSSEEACDTMLPAIALCHHAPFATEKLGDPHSPATGVPIPLTSLVYHDCLVMPWFMQERRGGWGIPMNDWSYLYALLTGGTVYVDVEATDEDLRLAKIALQHNERVQLQRLVRHEFIDDDYRRQRSTFEDGTTVEIDLDRDTWEIREKGEA